MTLRQSLRSLLARVFVSERRRRWSESLHELWRRLSGRRRRVSVFVELDDPYSYLLSHFLPAFREHFDIDLVLYLTAAPQGDYRPDSDLYARYAQTDCQRLATELGIPFLDKGKAPPVEHRRLLIDTLAARQALESFDSEVLNSLAAYWRGDVEAVARIVEGEQANELGARLLADNQRRLLGMGHYQSATLHYAGEWYWGVDRLHYLLRRLDSAGAAKSASLPPRLAAAQQVMDYALPVTPPNAARSLGVIDFFYSVRSPFSYLSLSRTLAIAKSFGLDVQIRPVLPMVMRGMPVPEPKIRYLLLDAAREARRRGIPFGRLRDPLGVGAERCLAAFFAAEAKGLGARFLQCAGEAIWARAVDVSTDRGLQQVVSDAGVSWQAVLSEIDSGRWREIVAENKDSMHAAGSWGVPTVRLGEFVVWGQDRDWLLVRHIEEQCDSGDGILV